MLLIVSGPSGVGKSRLIDLAHHSFGFGQVVPVTSRTRRPGEIQGVDYEFVSKDAFQDLVRNDSLCAWDYVLQNYYGYRRELQYRLSNGENLIVHALARMALRMSRTLPDVFLLFLDPGSDALLETRLAKREHTPTDMLLRRMHWAEEKEHSPMFDWIVRNADVTPTEDLMALTAEVLERFH